MQAPAQIQVVPVQNISPLGSRPLVEGSSVFVRVLSDNGNGSFLVSAGGNRLSVQSQNPLSVGETFIARVESGSSSRILLVPVEEKNPFMNQASGIQSYLGSESVILSPAAYRVLQFMEQSGMKISRDLMDRAERIGKKFPGKEKLASEAAAILLQKGINPSEENILSLMSLSLGDYQGGKNNGGNQDEKDGSVNEGENFISRLYPGGTGSGTGLLTYMNHVAGGKKHWIFLPYEWNSDAGKAEGIIRLLIDLEQKETEKIVLNCELNSTKFFFVLYCSKSKGEEVRFFTLPPLLPSKIKAEELRLGGFLSSGMSAGNPVAVTYSDSACSDGLCTVEENASTVETLA